MSLRPFLKFHCGRDVTIASSPRVFGSVLPAVGAVTLLGYRGGLLDITCIQIRRVTGARPRAPWLSYRKLPVVGTSPHFRGWSPRVEAPTYPWPPTSTWVYTCEWELKG